VIDLKSSEGWRLEYKGLSLKLKRGKQGARVFRVISNKSTDLIKVRVDEVVGDVKISVEPKEFKLNKSEVNVKVSVIVPKEVKFRPIWLAKLSFEGSERSESAYLGVLPLDETCNRVVIRRAKSSSPDYAVGAVGSAKSSNYYISYRWRNGNALRGEVLEIARSKEGLSYQTIKSFNKREYDYKSFEASTLTTHDNNFVFLYCADVGGYWRIFKAESERVEELSLPGEPIIDKGKDPTMFYDETLGTTIIAYSDGRNKGHDLTILRTRDFKSFKAEVVSLLYSKLIDQGNCWARTHIHAGKVTKVNGYYVLFYDALPKRPKAFGSGWLGVTISKDLLNWVDLTPDKPLWKGSGFDETFRYVDLYCDGEKYILYAEEEFDSGEKNLVAYYDSDSPNKALIKG